MYVVLLTSHLWEFKGPSRLWHPENPRHHTFLQAQLEATVPLATWLQLHSECPQVFRKYAVHLQSDTAIHCVLGQILWSRGPCHQFWAVCIELQLLLGPFLPFEKLPQWILQPAKLADYPWNWRKARNCCSIVNLQSQSVISLYQHSCLCSQRNFLIIICTQPKSLCLHFKKMLSRVVLKYLDRLI